MAVDNLQLVTFALGNEKYGVDIMKVNSIVRAEGIREIPNSPAFIQGIFNLRGEIIPVINLHKRFDIPDIIKDEEDLWFDAMMIIQLDKNKIGLVIDDVSRVVSLDPTKIQPAPQSLGGINREYIQGIYNHDDLYLVLLDVTRIFNPAEMNQLKNIGV